MIAQELKEFADKIQLPLLRRAVAFNNFPLNNILEEYYVIMSIPYAVARMFEIKFRDRIRVYICYGDEALKDAPRTGIKFRKMWVGIMAMEDPNNSVFFIDVNNIERENDAFWTHAQQKVICKDIIDNNGANIITHSPFYTQQESMSYYDTGIRFATLERDLGDRYILRPVDKDISGIEHFPNVKTDGYGLYVLMPDEETKRIDFIVNQFQYLIYT